MKLSSFPILLLTSLAATTLADIFPSVAKPICGDISSSKIIQLQTPQIPPRECLYHIEAFSKNVCQLRVDLKYTLAPPSLPSAENKLRYATCDVDYFQAGDLRLCGEETSQHIYMPFNRTDGVKRVSLSVVLANRLGSNDLPTAMWDIRITQLECPVGASVRSVSTSDGFLIAPPGCLQYFPQPAGVVTSFNFLQGKGVYPGHMNYAICFRRNTDTKSLKLTSKFFQLGTNVKGQKTDANCYGGFNVKADYLMIPQAEIKRKLTKVTYLCGDSMSGQEVISTNPGPLFVLFNSNDQYKNENGFSVQYKVVS